VKNVPSKWSRIFGASLLAVMFLNFFAMMATSIALHGSAGNGKMSDGRFYVGNRGQYREVSREAWLWSKHVHTANWITIPLGLLGLILFAPGPPARRWRGSVAETLDHEAGR
jgi:hypothetical protein